MMVSHEVPVCLLEESRKFNDYDYALVHLFSECSDISAENAEIYKNFFIESLKHRRTVYLDNSLFELEEMFDHNKFALQAEELSKYGSNFYYIVPDSLRDINETLNSFEKFTKEYKIKGYKIGVVQGKTEQEILECFKFMKAKADIVAIGFNYSFYIKDSRNKFQQYLEGRQKLICKLIDLNLLQNTKIHLLGCGLPQEFKKYKNIKEIVSIDTSNPIVHGLHNIRYSENGLDDKLSIKLKDLINIDSSKITKDVFFNIKKFKEFIS